MKKKFKRKSLSEKRLRKLAEKMFREAEKKGDIVPKGDIWVFLSYVSDHKNDTL